MSRRSDIINSFIAHIAASVQFSGRRGLQFLHEINSFPSFYVHVTGESRKHDSRGSKQAVIRIDVRAYDHVRGQDAIELIVRQLETAVQTYAAQHVALVYEARTISVRTDEGLMEPYSACDMSVEILYGILDE